MIKFYQVFILLFAFNFSYAQEIEFGDVSIEELKLSESSIDKDADAEVLYKYTNTYFLSTSGTNSLVTKVHEKIKIYNKEGFDYATEYVDLFTSRNNKEQVRKIKAFTYNIEGGKVVKTPLEKDQIFETELSYNFDQVKFTMPNVKEGSVIEFKYQIESPFIWNIDEFKFQYGIPIKKVEAELRTPKGFRFNHTYKGFLQINSNRSTKMDNRIGMDVIVNKFFLNNVPALKEEKYVDNINNYRSGVMFELVSIEIPQAGYFKSFAQSWSDVAKTIGNTDDYENKLDKTNSFDDELDSFLEGKTDAMDKMNTVFNYVKENIKWNGIDGKYFYNGIKKTLKEKKGNTADLNLLLVAMLRYAGLNANPVVISTKDNAIPMFPTVDRLNYVIAYVVNREDNYFLDATEEFSSVNILPVRDYNWRGILINNPKKVWKLVDLANPEISMNMYSVKAKLNEDGSIDGTFRARYTNHTAYKFREKYKDKGEEEFLIERENELQGMEISDYSTKNANTHEGYVSENFTYLLEEGADVIDDKLYVKPFLFLASEENPFKTKAREFPVDFGYTFSEKFMINIEVPKGYTLESKPAPVILTLPNENGKFKLLGKMNGNIYSISASFEIKKTTFSSMEYELLKEFFNIVVNKQSEQLVFSRI